MFRFCDELKVHLDMIVMLKGLHTFGEVDIGETEFFQVKKNIFI